VELYQTPPNFGKMNRNSGCTLGFTIFRVSTFFCYTFFRFFFCYTWVAIQNFLFSLTGGPSSEKCVWANLLGLSHRHLSKRRSTNMFVRADAPRQFSVSSPAFSSLQYSGGEKQADRRPAVSPAFFLASVGLCAGGGWGSVCWIRRQVRV
jgi:hypothetical protein